MNLDLNDKEIQFIIKELEDTACTLSNREGDSEEEAEFYFWKCHLSKLMKMIDKIKSEQSISPDIAGSVLSIMQQFYPSWFNEEELQLWISILKQLWAYNESGIWGKNEPRNLIQLF